jgi:tRNA dimethylallyltransferase
MTQDPFRNALILTGPTGLGKSHLALTLAERLGAEIISMDSMALYRHMDIGTAKPTVEDRLRIPHHLLDVLDPWESANVAWWLEQAAVCCRDIEFRSRRALFVGGTPLYLKALLHGLFDGPPGDETIRQRLLAETKQLGASALHDQLAQVDPASAARLHPNDTRRVIRALEVWELTGRPISSWQTQWAGHPQKETRDGLLRCLCLEAPRDLLYQRINARVEAMIAMGLVEEVKALLHLSQPLSREARQALGYKEMFDHLEGRASMPETVERIKTRSRNYAKRQLTWFRHLPECRMATRELTFAYWGLTMTDIGGA